MATPDWPQKLPADLGYSDSVSWTMPRAKTDWLAFQGASYFRSSGEENQYGGSARGIAVNTTASTKEEFPRFTEFWLHEPASKPSSVTIYALLDGPSLTGAYQFVAIKANRRGHGCAGAACLSVATSPSSASRR